MVAQSPFYRYVDAQGRAHMKFGLKMHAALRQNLIVKEYNLRGISYWALGYRSLKTGSYLRIISLFKSNG